ncbi:DsbE family thiol:disulfide interchange protein [Luminiphilus sp.]|nr:DsbE family thiol:disulfide interchange protein [Luminiphilus sp.]MDA9836173.1 DsbE family thiol:disulfide interchange protein [Luminiphilus sp.]MDA9915583.1 DsbE family thiol:disulfide interchange protein [Luminiphilus sp.]MDB2379738.1 DsbE family thiol:disulfide interchange protein [Luminiphilus sp.]MDB2434109.1 DsbE family thiol:disulfide interchange protein [Luminiphilus sp.]
MLLKRFLPLVAFAALVLLLVRGLALDPTALPSARVGQPLPEFDLQVLGGEYRRSAGQWHGKPALLNVWATWCFSCRVEHPYLLDLAESGVTIYGLNYKDDPAKALTWLEELGNPYAETVVDIDGDFGFDLGVYGAPETYVIDAAGTVQYRHVGVVDERVWTEQLAPFFGGGS